MSFYFGDPMQRLNIKPRSYGVEQRVEASRQATELGKGLVMELGNASTSFYAESSVPVGKVAIYAPRRYSGPTEYIRTLDSPTDPYEPGDNE